MSSLFTITPAQGTPQPILLSVPHCGTDFPPEVREQFLTKHIDHPDDTDWFVQQLYDFAPAMGITMIHAHVSRYVIDLNRDPENKPLYDDGRVITELCPTKTFFDEPLYHEPPSHEEIERRKAAYYQAYHDEIAKQLRELQQTHSHVLLWEAHSIRRLVPTIRKDPFPDMILGDQEGRTADKRLIETALTQLRAGTSQINHNDPFKGGYITRSFGQPEKNIHALQLEMTKDHYMDEETTTYLPERAEITRQLLQQTLRALCETLTTLNKSA